MTEKKPVKVYHLTAPDGKHYYLTEKMGSGFYPPCLVGDGTELSVHTSKSYGTIWYVSDSPISTFEKKHADRVEITKYTLKDTSAASVKYPLEISTQDYNERTDDSEDEDAPECALYEPVKVTIPGNTEKLNVELIDLDGPPPPPDQRIWVAALPYELTRHKELLHLFPGHLAGFRSAVAEAINARLGGYRPGLLGQRYGRSGEGGCEVGRDGVISAWRYVEYSPRQTRLVHNIGRSGRKLTSTHEQPQLTRVTIELRIADRIPGKNRAEATEIWDQELATLVDKIVNDLKPYICWHCGGKGFVSAKDVPAGVDTKPLHTPPTPRSASSSASLPSRS